jgi:uncharacterized delta-60 repeat protein
MQRKVKFKNILLTIAISTGLLVGLYYVYNRDTNRNKLNIETINQVDDIIVQDKKVEDKIDTDIEDIAPNIMARESEENREERVAKAISNIKGEYIGGIRKNPLRYSPIEVYQPSVINNNPIELPSAPTIPSAPINPIIPNIPNIPPDNDGDSDINNPTSPGDNNGGGENNPILLSGSKDHGFDTGTGFDAYVYTVSVQTDGKILAGGDFTTYQGVSANRIIRLNIDGSRDTSFNIGTGFNSSVVLTLAVQTDGKILAGGNFTTYQGVSANRIIRLNIDGSRDTSFNIGTGFDDFVSTLAVQTDGKILVSGPLGNYQGESTSAIIRLNVNGSRDTSFDLGTGFDASVSTLSVQSDGKILVGGGFSSYQGVSANKIIRLNIDGSRDTSFNIGTGFGDSVSVRILAVQSDGKILAGGDFNAYQGVSANKIIRLNIDGSRDINFDVGTGFDGTVNTIVLQSDGKILAGGYFNAYQEVSANKIIRLNINGSRDISFDVGTGFAGTSLDFFDAIYTLAISIQPEGKIIAGGAFESYQGKVSNSLIRINN